MVDFADKLTKRIEEIKSGQASHWALNTSSGVEIDPSVLKEFIQALSGFDLRLNQFCWVAVKNGMKFELCYVSNYEVLSWVKTQTAKGGWTYKKGSEKQDEIEELRGLLKGPNFNVARAVVLMIEISNAHTPIEQTKKLKSVRTKDDLPEPLTFSNSVGMLEAYRNGAHARNIKSVIDECEVVSIVGVNGKAVAVEDIVSKPGEETWFLIDCVNEIGATFNIISDGEVFHPVDRYRKHKITRRLKPKKSVNLGQMNATDKINVKNAIDEFISKI